jgi:simple sugar transport system ATP-binding protein
MLNPGAPSAGALYAGLIVHNYNQVFEVCDRINFLHSGEIVLDASTSETTEDVLILFGPEGAADQAFHGHRR